MVSLPKTPEEEGKDAGLEFVRVTRERYEVQTELLHDGALSIRLLSMSISLWILCHAIGVFL
jgi:hypothetical protein